MNIEEVKQDKAYENVKNISFLLIPIEFDFKALELDTKEKKDAFLERFVKDVENVPSTTIKNNEWDEPVEEVCGVINRAEIKDNYMVDIYAYSWNLASINYNREPTTEENATKPLGEKLTVSSISLESMDRVNKTYYDIIQKKKEITEKISKRINEQKEVMKKIENDLEKKE